MLEGIRVVQMSSSRVLRTCTIEKQLAAEKHSTWWEIYMLHNWVQSVAYLHYWEALSVPYLSSSNVAYLQNWVAASSREGQQKRSIRPGQTCTLDFNNAPARTNKHAQQQLVQNNDYSEHGHFIDRTILYFAYAKYANVHTLVEPTDLQQWHNCDG